MKPLWAARVLVMAEGNSNNNTIGLSKPLPGEDQWPELRITIVKARASFCKPIGDNLVLPFSLKIEEQPITRSF